MRVTTRPIAPNPQAHESLTRELNHYVRSIGKLQEAVPPPSSRLGWVPQALAARVVSSSAAAALLFADGYTYDAETLTRSIAGAVISYALLLQEDTEARSYLFLAHGRARARRQKHNLKVVEVMDPDLEAAVESLMESNWAEQLREIWPGPEPAKLGRGREGWAGLNDADMADRAGATRLYRLVYGPLSDSTHISGIVIQNVLARMNEIGYFGLGPDFKEGSFLAMALRDCLELLAERMIDFYAMPDGHAERTALADRLTAAIDTYKDALGITEELGRADGRIRAELARLATPPE